MKKKLLVLAGLFSFSNPILVSGCEKQGNKETNQQIPNYNLNNLLNEINKLEFRRQFQNDRLENYIFDNSWFSIFEVSDNFANFKKLKELNEREEISNLSLTSFENKGDEIITMKTPEVNGEVPYCEINNLKTTVNLLIDQNFLISGPYLHYRNTFNLSKNKMIDWGEKITFKVNSKDLPVPANKKILYYVKLQTTIKEMKGLLTFNLRKNSTIITKITNIKNNEEKFMSYSFETLLKNAETDYSYRSILNQSEGFLKAKNNNTNIEINLESILQVISNYKILQGEINDI